MKKRKVDPWFPFWIDKWLFGSTRIELKPDERGVFVDLMAFSKKDDGYIRANEGVPYLESQLCGLFNITPELLKRTIEKCIKYGKAKRHKDGTIYMTSHDVYKLSPRQERRIEDEMAEETDMGGKKRGGEAKKTVTKIILEESILDKKKEEEPITNITANQELQIIKELSTVKGMGDEKIATLIIYLRELSIEFPNLDYVDEIKLKVAWWRDNPLTKKSNIHLQLRNWFVIAQNRIKESKSVDRVGAPRGEYHTKYPMLFLNSVYAILRKQGKDNSEYSKKLFALSDDEAHNAWAKYKDSPAEFIKFLEAKKG